MRIVIGIVDVHQGKNRNWLEFDARVGVYDMNQKYKIEYSGTNVEPSFYLNDEQLEELKEQLNEDFGFNPFTADDIRKAKETIGKLKSYAVGK